MRFSSEYQPSNRGRKPGSLNKVNQLLREAAPDVIQAVIERAKEGDVPAASLVLARTAAPLKAAASPIELTGPIESMADYVRKLLQAAAEGADPQVVAQLIKAASDAVKVIEYSELEQRVADLESNS
jgi:hypothetical protein